MKKLISLLRLAHSIEVGAREAYRWHSKAEGSETKVGLDIFLMHHDEETHRKTVVKLLNRLEGKPNKIMDAAMWVVGNLVGLACFISPKKASALGARLFEAVGGDIYFELADLAHDAGMINTVGVLINMAAAERQHEEYFRSIYLS